MTPWWFGLLHNCVLHPSCGVLWFVADTVGAPRLDAFADRLHAWEPRRARR